MIDKDYKLIRSKLVESFLFSIYLSHVQIKFESGELLIVLSKVEDIIGNTVPLLDIEMTGTIPKNFSTINVDIDDYKER